MSDFQNSSNSNDIKQNLSESGAKGDDSTWEEEPLPEEVREDSGEPILDQPQDNSDEDLDQAAKDEDREQESRFKDGQVLRFVKVRFSGNAKAFPFFIGKRQFQYGQTVVAMSDRGMMVGYINSFPYEKIYDKSLNPIRSIARVATPEDIQQQKDFVIKEKDSERICLELIEKYRLDMVLTHVEFTQFGKKAVFFFTAPARVDFRDLVKELVGRLRMRIELRQISLRDRAAAIGGIGVCGLQTCCNSFLSAYGNVSIKMAKNQNLALVPTKLNGVCGQIKCCIKYEDEVYSEKRSRLPRENSFVQLKNGDFGKVLQLTLLEEQFEMLTDRGIIRNYAGELFDPKLIAAEGKVFPESFEFVTRDTGPMVTLANSPTLLPQYRPKVESKVIEEDEVSATEEITTDEGDFSEEDDEGSDPNIQIPQELKDTDEDDAATEMDIATEVQHRPASAPSPIKPLPQPQIKVAPPATTEADKKKQKGQDKAFHRFKKRSKKR